MKHQKTATAALLAALLATGCGGGNGSDSPAPVTPWVRGTLLGTPQLTASVGAGELKRRLQDGPSRDQALLLLAGDPVCDVQVHAIQYSTEGGAGEKTTASGALMLPGGSDPRCSGAKPLVLYAHATHPEKSFNIAQLDDSANAGHEEALALATLFATHGFIVVAPNYAGYDTSTLAYHPFLNAQQQSTEMIDALSAAKEALVQLAPRTTAGAKLFLTGYSEGGHVAMATHRALQQAGIPVTASAPMSGPYALAQELDDNFAGRVHVGATLFGTFLATSYQKAYGTIYARPTDLYESAWANGIETLLPGADAATLANTGKLPQSALFSTTPPQAPPGSGLQAALDAMTPPRGTSMDAVFARGFGADNLFTNSARLAYLQDMLSRPDQPANGLRVAARANDLRGWAPAAPVLLCGDSQDATVSFSVNTGAMQQLWSGLPPGQVSVLDVDTQPTDTSDPFLAEKLGFGLLKGAIEVDARLQGNDPVWELARNYHAAVFPFCASAARRFFAAF